MTTPASAAALRSTIDPRSTAFTEAAAAMTAKIAELEAEHAKALDGGGEKYVARHHARGKMTARERIEALVDPDSPFLELSPLAAYGMYGAPGETPVPSAGVVGGIGRIHGRECVVVANDATAPAKPPHASNDPTPSLSPELRFILALRASFAATDTQP